MPFLLDTNSLSEFIVKVPNRGVVTRIRTLPATETYVPSVAIGEIMQGIEEMAESKRKSQLTTWLFEQLIPQYTHRILDFGKAEALRWGKLRAELRTTGFEMETEDSLIAAIALEHGLTVVTRNEADFVNAGVSIYNPWNS